MSRTGSQTPKTGFLMTWLKLLAVIIKIHIFIFSNHDVRILDPVMTEKQSVSKVNNYFLMWQNQTVTTVADPEEVRGVRSNSTPSQKYFSLKGNFRKS